MDQDARPLNQLKVMEYLDDYKLYLAVEDMPADQRNLTTYFAEFEHQEGQIKAWKKRVVAHRMAAEYMDPLHKALQEVEETVKRFVLQETRGECDTYVGDKPIPNSMSHEQILQWVADYVSNMLRGIDKGGYV